jgi:hypothetical protein
MVMFHRFLYVYQRVKLHFPMVFLRVSYGFPMVCPLKPPFSDGVFLVPQLGSIGHRPPSAQRPPQRDASVAGGDSAGRLAARASSRGRCCAFFVGIIGYPLVN